MYKYKHLDLSDYFGEDDAIDIIVFFYDGTNAMVHDILGSVSIDEQFLSVQGMGPYARSFYFESEKVRYFAICPRENGNAWKYPKPVEVDEVFDLED